MDRFVTFWRWQVYWQQWHMRKIIGIIIFKSCFLLHTLLYQCFFLRVARTKINWRKIIAILINTANLLIGPIRSQLLGSTNLILFWRQLLNIFYWSCRLSLLLSPLLNGILDLGCLILILIWR